MKTFLIINHFKISFNVYFDLSKENVAILQITIITKTGAIKIVNITLTIKRNKNLNNLIIISKEIVHLQLTKRKLLIEIVIQDAK